jgi:hypothetical protein
MDFTTFLSEDNIRFFVYIVGFVITILSLGLAIQWRYYKLKLENREERYKAEKENAQSKHNKESAQLQQKSFDECQELKRIHEEEIKNRTNLLVAKENTPIIQDMKMVYVKYLHIRRESQKPVYKKYINRLEKEIDVHSEYHYYRFNKYNKSNNSITITDRSSGVVDQNILYPWKKLTFTDKPSQKIQGVIAQDVKDSDTYFSATTYYNGFKENNEDIGMKMEMDTNCARMVSDFSSIVGLKKLFVKEPDAYKIQLDGRKVKLLGLEKISEGIYHLVAYNLKKGESLLLDFHVNWNYLNDE